jgi:drug/metabolite transporter (DMT)-like permease
MEHKKLRYLLLLALVNLIWAGQGTAIKFLDGHLGPVAITFLPFYVATLLMIPLLVRERRRHRDAPRPTLKDWSQFAIAGIVGQVLAQLGMTWGVSRALASNGAILTLMIPVITAILASVILSEKPTALRVISLMVGLCGAFLLSSNDIRQSSFIYSHYLTGNLLILVGTFGSSFYNVYCKRLMRRFSEVEILIFSYITASCASIPLLIWMEPLRWKAVFALDWCSWIAFAFLALFMYSTSMLLFFYVLQKLPVMVASASMYLVPVFGVMIAGIVLRERLSKSALSGAGVVLVATILIMRYDPSVRELNRSGP